MHPGHESYLDRAALIRSLWRDAMPPHGETPRKRQANAKGGASMSFVLAIDQGTTSSRAIVFRSDISIAASAQAEFPQHFPASGWVEHEPEDIWTSTVMVCREAIEKAGITAKDIAAI